MQSITDIIQPIKLLSGSHGDTAQTGSGCFMNVIAYLNGEAQITDQSTCVCVTVRRIAIWLNDWLHDDERHEMIPFIERAMGSVTDDRVEMGRRLKLMVEFAYRQRDIAQATAAAAAAKWAADNAAKWVAAAAKWAASAAKWAADAAKWAASAAAYANAAANAADNAAKWWAANAANAAADAANAADADADAKFRQQIKVAAFEYLDAVLPQAQKRPTCLIERAHQLVTVAEGA